MAEAAAATIKAKARKPIAKSRDVFKTVGFAELIGRSGRTTQRRKKIAAMLAINERLNLRTRAVNLSSFIT